MNKDEIRAARSALGLSASRFGEAVGVNPRTVRRWEAGDSPVPGSVAKLVVRLLAELCQAEVRESMARQGITPAGKDVAA